MISELLETFLDNPIITLIEIVIFLIMIPILIDYVKSNKNIFSIIITVVIVLLMISICYNIYEVEKPKVYTGGGCFVDTSEIDSFNHQFMSYEQEQTGYNVKALIEILIANADKYIDEPNNIPRVYYSTDDNENGKIEESNINDAWLHSVEVGYIDDYVADLKILRNEIQNKHRYWIKLEFGNNGMVNKIFIFYGKANKSGKLIYNMTIED